MNKSTMEQFRIFADEYHDKHDAAWWVPTYIDEMIDAFIEKSEKEKPKYICKNCGHDIPCVITVGRIEGDDINELINCKYSSKFKKVVIMGTENEVKARLPGYDRGFYEGYKEGYQKAFESYSFIINKCMNPTPITLTVSQKEAERIIDELKPNTGN